MLENKPLTQQLIEQTKNSPEAIDFTHVIETIEAEYKYTPAAFTNGDLTNDAGTNEGSCKIFSFAEIHSLDQQETLALFGKYYREDVLGNPEGNDHGNIRNFMASGWAGINFTTQPLTPN